MKRIKLSRDERNIEKAIERGVYRAGRRDEYERIARAIAKKKKDMG